VQKRAGGSQLAVIGCLGVFFVVEGMMKVATRGYTGWVTGRGWERLAAMLDMDGTRIAVATAAVTAVA
jgi:hypothetical protein